MKTFLIDLENVKNQGFTGIDKLAAEDRVFVFYSDGANTLNIPTIQLINRSACSVEYVPLQRSGHNAMDFQIVGLLGFLIGSEKQGHFGIISQDQGYLAPVEFFMDHSADVLDIHVLVTPNILTAVRKWEAQAQNSRKILTTGKQKKEKNHSRHQSAEDVIDVEALQSQTSEELPEEVEKETTSAVVSDPAVPVIPEESVETAVAEETVEVVVESSPSEDESTCGDAADAEPMESQTVEESTAVAEETIPEDAPESQVEEPVAEVKAPEPVGVYTEEISNAFVGAIVDSAEASSEETEVPSSTEKKNSRSSRSKKKKTVKKPVEKTAENTAQAETEKEQKVKEEKTEAVPAEKKENSKSEKKPEQTKTEKKERSEKKKETRKNIKKASEGSVDPKDIQTVHNLIGDKLDEEQVQLEGEIVKAVLATEGKNHFYQYFNHTLGREKGGNLYHAIRNDYEKLVKALKA